MHLADRDMFDKPKRLMKHVLAAKEYLKRMHPQPTQAGIVRSKLLANAPLGKKN